MNALSHMVGGDHYTKRAMQPVQFIAENAWDFFLGSALKYLTRWRDKAGAVDLQKAKHFIELREETDGGLTPVMRVAMDTYLVVNRIQGEEDVAALLALDIYAYSPTRANRDVFFRCVDRLLAIAA